MASSPSTTLISALITIAVRTGTGRNPINPVPNIKRIASSAAAISDITCVLPPNCSPIAVLDTLPLTGQHPINDAVIFPAAHASISLLSSSLYPLRNAKLFSASKVSAITTTATVILVPRHDITSTDAKSGSEGAGIPGSTEASSATP